MTDTVLETSVWPVNELGEIVVVQGVGTQTVVDYLPTNQIVVNEDQQVVFALPPFTPWSNSPWQTPTLSNGWANVAGYIPTRYRKVNDEVQVVIAIQNGVALTMFTLPVGYRPTASYGFPAQIHDNTNAPDFGHIHLNSSGVVSLSHPGSLNNHRVTAVFSFWTS